MAKVLIAEDDPSSLRILVHIIERMGHTAIRSTNGARALDILADNGDIDLLITDIQMPEMDGRDLIKASWRLDNEIGVIIVSGVAKPREVMDLLQLGADFFLTKPINPSDLQNYVTAALANLAVKRRRSA